MKHETTFVEIIYTFSGLPQQMGRIGITQYVLSNKELFFTLLTSNLSIKEKELLCNISCCIYYAEKLDIESAEWYNFQNGKFYDDEIPDFIQKIYGIGCTYEPINK